MLDLKIDPLNMLNGLFAMTTLWVFGSGSGVGYLPSRGHPADIGFQLGKACYPCSR